MSKVRHCTKVEYTQKGKANPLALWEGILSVWAHLWAVSPPVFVFSLFFVPCRVQQSGTEDLPKINLSSSVRLGHEETGSYKCRKTQSRTWSHNSDRRPDAHPDLSHNAALNNGKSRAAELRTNEQKKIPESESSACCYEFSAFLDQWIRAFIQAASKRTHKRICAHRCEDTHVGNTCKAAVSQSAMSLFRCSEQTASLRNFKLVLLSRLLTGASGAELKTTLEHMSYWSDQSQQSCRHTITSYLSHRGDGWKDNWDGACHPYTRTPTSEERTAAIYIRCLCFYKEVGTLVKLISLLSLYWFHRGIINDNPWAVEVFSMYLLFFQWQICKIIICLFDLCLSCFVLLIQNHSTV